MTKTSASFLVRRKTSASMTGMKPVLTALFIAACLLLSRREARANSIVDLGPASHFAVLAGSAITITTASTVTGDLGAYPGMAIVGLGNLTLNGSVHSGDTVAHHAEDALLAAYNDAAGRAPTTTFAAVHDLGDVTLTSGIYNDPTSFGITGTLTLDAQGNPNAVWIFQAGSTLITAADSQIVLAGGARAANVFWQVGSSATLGAQSDFAGDILALTDATLAAGATVDGRVLALNGAVTLGGNIISTPRGIGPSGVPDAGGTLLLFGSALAGLLAFEHWCAQRRDLSAMSPGQ